MKIKKLGLPLRKLRQEYNKSDNKTKSFSEIIGSKLFSKHCKKTAKGQKAMVKAIEIVLKEEKAKKEIMAWKKAKEF